jgi:hypothetical protein
MIERLRPGTRVVTTSAVPTDAAALPDDDRGRSDWIIHAAPAAPAAN